MIDIILFPVLSGKSNVEVSKAMEMAIVHRVVSRRLQLGHLTAQVPLPIRYRIAISCQRENKIE